MASLPTIYTIQASDAPQHAGRLQEILQTLKTENRIEHFATLGPDEDLSSITDTVKEEDLILVVLTRQLDSQREQIETKLETLKTAHPGVRIGEVIVDNVPYENKFITFPPDLKNIRGREDMDTVWRGIEQSLKEMFPAKKAPEPTPPIDWPKYLKTAGILIGVIVAFFIVRGLFGGDNEGQVVADFNINPTECEKAPCAVEFSNTSENADAYRWDFGDGASSSEANPSHRYEKPGTYTATLIVSRDGQRDEKTARIMVPAPESQPVANFEIHTKEDDCSAPCIARFNNTSENADDYHWDFGDGATSSEPLPIHRYEKPGTYTVTLIVSKEGQRDEMVAKIIVLSPTVCEDAVQGRIAWDYSGHRKWNPVNVARLCRGAETSVEPARCFQEVMHSGVDWGGGTSWAWENALNLCQGSRNANTTISCFKEEIASDVPWPQAINTCETR